MGIQTSESTIPTYKQVNQQYKQVTVMEVVPGTSFVMTLCSCLYLLTISCPSVSGKCRGSWAIHACFGGNGKRSSLPSLPSLPSSTHHRPTVLDKLPPTSLSQL